MEKEIDDQLTECRYQTVKRKQIDCACKLGTGVTKGPVTGDKVRRGWKQDEQTGEHKLDVSTGQQPAYRYVDSGASFPTWMPPASRSCNGDVRAPSDEPQAVARTALLDGFDKDAIRRLLQLAPSTVGPGLPCATAQHPRRHPAGDRRSLSCVRIFGAVRTRRHARHRAVVLMSRDETVTGIADEAMKQMEEIDPLVVGQWMHLVLSGRGAEICHLPVRFSGECIVLRSSIW